MAESSGNTIMTLLAKLKLDAQEFDTELSNAQQEAEGFEGPKADPLTLENKDYVDKVDEAKTKTSTFGDTVKEIFSGAAANLAAAGVTALINGFIQSVANLMDLAKNLGKDISDNAKEVGISTDEYQKWDRVLQRSGGSAKDLAKGMSNIQTYLDNMDVEKKPKGYQDLASAFDELGVSVKDSEGDLRSTGDILNDVIFALAGMRDGADKANLAQKLLGNNKNLNKFLETTVSDMKELRRSAPILSEDQIESSVRYNDSLERMNAALTDLKSTVSLQLLEPLTGIVDAMTSVMNFFNPDNWKDKSAAGMFKSIDEEAEGASLNVEATAAQAETLIDKMLALGPASQQTAEQHEQWVTYADWLIKNIPSLRNEINLETGELSGEANALKENVRQWKERQKAQILQQAIADKREVVAQKLSEAIGAQTQVTMTEASMEGSRAKLIEFVNNRLKEDADFRNRFESIYGGRTVQDESGKSWLPKDATMEELTQTGFHGIGAVFGGYSSADYTEYLTILGEFQESERQLITDQNNLTTKTNEYNAAVDEFNLSADSAQKLVNALGDAINNLPASKDVEINIHQNGGLPGSEPVTESKAAGDWYVPYDDFVARLHRGEAVLTASQARRYRNGETGSSFDMDGLVNGIIGAVQAGMAGATVNSYLNGHSINADMSKDTIRQIKSRRFAT
jgi:hypothetical protein